MAEQILDQYDGVTEYFDFDEAEQKVTVRREIDLQPLVDHAKACFNEGIDRKSEFRRIGSYPREAAAIWARQHGIADYMDIFKAGNEKLLERFVNDRDTSAFRTLPGTYTFRSR